MRRLRLPAYQLSSLFHKLHGLQHRYSPIRRGTVQRRQFASSENAPSIDYVSKLREFYSLDEKNSMIVPVFKKALLYGNNVAIRDHNGEYSYFQVFSNSKRLSRQIANLCGSGSLSTVAVFYTNNLLGTVTLWASWMCGQVVMPIESSLHFQDQLRLLKSVRTRLLIATAVNGQLATKLAYELDLPVLILDQLFIQKPSDPFNYGREVFISSKSVVIEGMLANDFYSTRDALLVPTVNVQGHQKIVVLSHRNLCHQLHSLTQVLQLGPEDRLLNVLSSSKQSRGYISASLAPFTVGGTLHTFDEPFDAPRCWSTILGINAQQRERPNVLLAEPEVYRSLIAEYDKIFQKDNRMAEFIKNYCQKNFRLMLSNGDALSTSLVDRWRQITGHHLINMYYMPETGVIFYDRNYKTNDAQPIQQAPTAAVAEDATTITTGNGGESITNAGLPIRPNLDLEQDWVSPLGILNSYSQTMPDVRVRIIDANNNIVLDKNRSEIEIMSEESICSGLNDSQEAASLNQNNNIADATVIGNLLVAGPCLFRSYFCETAAPEEGEYFFNTGLVVAYDKGSFKILGRSKCLNTSMIAAEEEVDPTGPERKHQPFPELSRQFCLHEAIDYIHLKEEGIVCGIKPDRELSLDQLKYFHAFIHRDSERAVLFHLIKVKSNE